MQPMAAAGLTWLASSKMTTSKCRSAGRYWLTASGDIMKQGLIAWHAWRARSIRTRTGRGPVFFSASWRVEAPTPGGPPDQDPDRQVPGLLLRLLADDGRLAGVAARPPGVAGTDDVPGRRADQ